MTNRQKLFKLAEDLDNGGFDDLAYEVRYAAEYKTFDEVEQLLIILCGKENLYK